MEIEVNVLTNEEVEIVNKILASRRKEAIRKGNLLEAYTDFINAYDRIIKYGGRVRYSHRGYVHSGGVFLNRPHVSTACFEGIDF